MKAFYNLTFKNDFSKIKAFLKWLLQKKKAVIANSQIHREENEL